MLFNSFVFAVFLPVVFIIYWLLGRNLRLQNVFLIIASYIFYGWWNYRFLSLIVISTGTDYTIGRLLDKGEDKRERKLLLYSSIGINIGISGFIKYFDFFIVYVGDLLTALGFHADPFTLRVILPVGISFYTFQTMSYTIDICYRRMVDQALFEA